MEVEAVSQSDHVQGVLIKARVLKLSMSRLAVYCETPLPIFPNLIHVR